MWSADDGGAEMRFPGNVVIEEDCRRHGNGRSQANDCLYCRGALGGPHQEDCVIIGRPVKVQMSMELIIEKPRSWDAHMIDFHLNDSSWCVDNIAADVARAFEAAAGEDARCLCNRISFE